MIRLAYQDPGLITQYIGEVSDAVQLPIAQDGVVSVHQEVAVASAVVVVVLSPSAPVSWCDAGCPGSTSVNVVTTYNFSLSVQRALYKAATCTP